MREARAHRAVVAEGDDVGDRRHAGLTTTSSPTATRVTSSPTASTTPATSQPGTCGSGGLGSPRVTHRSMWLRALATTRMRTSSGPSGGRSICAPAVRAGRLVEDPCVQQRPPPSSVLRRRRRTRRARRRRAASVRSARVDAVDPQPTRPVERPASSSVDAAIVQSRVRHVGAGRQAPPRLPARPQPTSSASTSTTSSPPSLGWAAGATSHAPRWSTFITASDRPAPPPTAAPPGDDVGDGDERAAVGVTRSTSIGKRVESPARRRRRRACAAGRRRDERSGRGSRREPPRRPASASRRIDQRRRAGRPARPTPRPGRIVTVTSSRRPTDGAVGDDAAERRARRPRAAPLARRRVRRDERHLAGEVDRAASSCARSRRRSAPRRPTTSARPSPATQRVGGGDEAGIGRAVLGQAGRPLVGGEVLAGGRRSAASARAHVGRREPRRRRRLGAAVLVDEHRQQPGERRPRRGRRAARRRRHSATSRSRLVEDAREHRRRVAVSAQSPSTST